MSTLKVDGIRSNSATSDAITLASNGTCTANITNNLSNRNIIINGAMQVAQRGTTTGMQSSYGGTDRFRLYIGGDGRATISQDTDVPTGQGFSYSTKIDVTTADSNAASNRGWWGQRIERDICQPVAKGTSNAKQLILSFHIKSPKSGTHIVGLYDNENNRNVLQSYTVSPANTWEKKTVVFPADTTGTIPNGTTYGLQVSFLLMSGSNSQASSLGTTWHTYDVAKEGQGGQNLFDSTSNNIYFTGIQLEVDQTGSGVATDYEHRTFHDELHRCFRYYYEIAKPEAESLIGDSLNYDTNDHMTLRFPVEMRIEPNFIVSDFSNAFRIYGTSGGRNVNTLTVNTGVGSTKCIMIECSGGTNGSRNFVRCYNANSGVYATIAADAEL